tara:strand:+ start:10614 stop:14195 length:3582 start_codon:yes stop_codon:yes gene_type:complete
MSKNMIMVDGNEAAAWVACKVSEVCAIYPITPSSSMAELADSWSIGGVENIWGTVPSVVEMQSEAGVAGALHGSLQSGALCTTFTASQGLMLMLPNMYKIAGELSPTVFHVASRSLAAQGLSIFGDHQDVMAARSTGFAMLSSSSVQEAQDLALVAHAATLQSRVPFVHFFDGFRTSHEINKIDKVSDDVIAKMVDINLVRQHRERALNPDHPFMRGTAQNPDVYFQGRESVNLYYEKVPDIVQHCMDKFATLTGRRYHLVEYYGDRQAERVIVVMGSGLATLKATAKRLNEEGEKVGVIGIHLFRPFPITALLNEIPASVKSVAVLDRTKEPGSNGEPLYQDVLTTLVEGQQQGRRQTMPKMIAGRYGLSSKEFTPAMCKSIFDELKTDFTKLRFTVGIHDDLTHLSLKWDERYLNDPENQVQCVFYGLGSDGTVGANKNSIKIIGNLDDYYAQAYFVYDSKKSGSMTVSHLRFGPEPIDSPYLIQKASFIACHQFNFTESVDILSTAAFGATLLLNSPYSKDAVWSQLPLSLQKRIIELDIKLYVVDAYSVAAKTNMGQLINTVMQTCFFALAGVLPKDEAIALIKRSIQKTYAKKGKQVVEQNFEAVDSTLANLYAVTISNQLGNKIDKIGYINPLAPAFAKQVTAKMMSGKGDLIPVSQLPVDGTYPSATSQWEKRNVAQYIPEWQEGLCIECGNCSFICPHASIRAKFYHSNLNKSAPESAKSIPISARGFPNTEYTLQVYPEDCTGCGLCVQACPVRSEALDKNGLPMRAIKMVEKETILEREKINLNWFESLPFNDRSRVDFSTVRGVQFLQPLFEFSGACAGCGETPYLKVLTQLFGDRMMVANATGCSSIYGGNLPTTPWSKNEEGRGPAWSNSLFEDNAEFGYGFRLTADKHRQQALKSLVALRCKIGESLVDSVIQAPQRNEAEIRSVREKVKAIQLLLAKDTSEPAQELKSLLEHMVRRSVWIVGGDGWAYDIGSAGLDHVLASGRDVNVLIMDTEVYSNTGGQMSKSTPLGAVAKFAAGGKLIPKKEVALQAIAYGNVYVARVAIGANPQQTLQAMREAEAYDGPSLIIAYSHCIAHGIDMEQGLAQQKRAVDSGHWPLIRYNPVLREQGLNPFSLDSLRPSMPLSEYRKHESRFQVLAATNSEEAKRLMSIAQQVSLRKWGVYEEMATRSAQEFHPDAR